MDRFTQWEAELMLLFFAQLGAGGGGEDEGV